MNGNLDVSMIFEIAQSIPEKWRLSISIQSGIISGVLVRPLCRPECSVNIKEKFLNMNCFLENATSFAKQILFLSITIGKAIQQE
jgi:hypothetical protein